MRLISTRDKFQLELTKKAKCLNSFQIIIFLQNSIKNNIIKQKYSNIQEYLLSIRFILCDIVNFCY